MYSYLLEYWKLGWILEHRQPMCTASGWRPRHAKSVRLRKWKEKHRDKLKKRVQGTWLSRHWEGNRVRWRAASSKTVNFKSSMTKTIDELERGGSKRARISLLSAKKWRTLVDPLIKILSRFAAGPLFFSNKIFIWLTGRFRIWTWDRPHGPYKSAESTLRYLDSFFS